MSISFYLLLFFCICGYIQIGYTIGIVRYRFARSKAVQTEGWKHAWQAWLFYPVTRAQKTEDGFKLASKKVWDGPPDRNRPVLYMKSHNYVSLLMFIWGPLLLLAIIQHLCLGVVVVFGSLKSFIEKRIFGGIYFCATFFTKKIINPGLPEDIREPETQLVVVNKPPGGGLYDGKPEPKAD